MPVYRSILARLNKGNGKGKWKQQRKRKILEMISQDDTIFGKKETEPAVTQEVQPVYLHT